jgi:hypothetical protein
MAGFVSWFIVGLSSAFAADAPSAFDDGWAWVPEGPRRVGAAERVVVADGAVVAIVDERGAVWRADGDGWVQVLDAARRQLGGSSREEEQRLAVEARVEELQDDRAADPLDVEYEDQVEIEEDQLASDPDAEDESEPEEEGAAAPTDDVSEVADDLQADLGSDPLLAAAAARADTTTHAFSIARGGDGTLWVGRPDGLWRVAGAEASRVLETPILSVAVDQTVVLAGTSDGIRYVDPATAVVFDVFDGTEGIAVVSLEMDLARPLAGTPVGLLMRDLVLGWALLPALSGRSIADAAVLDDGTLVAAGADGVWRLAASDGWSRATRVSGPRGAVGVLALGGAHALVGGASGVWETVDGGLTWSARSAGLLVPTVRDLADGPIAATVEGVFRLVDVGDLSGRPVADDFVQLGDLLAAARGRPELMARLPANARLKSALMPQIVVDALYTPSGDLGWGVGDGTDRGEDSDWWVTGNLVFSPARDTSGEIDPVFLEDDVFFDPESEAAMLGAQNERRVQAYDRALAGRIAQLYVARAALVVRQSEASQSAPLPDRVADALRVLELEARMDVLSGFSVPLVLDLVSQESP